MTRRRPQSAGQAALPLTGSRYRAGPVERLVAGDVKTLRELEALPPGVDVLIAGLRQAAREVDRAERDGDRWGKLAALRELRSLRERIGPLSALPQDALDVEALHARLSAEIRDAAQP